MMLKCYLKRKSGKLDAWVTGTLRSRFFGPRIVSGKVTLDDGTHVIQADKFVTVDYPTLLQHTILKFLPSRQVWGQLWLEGDMEPVRFGGDEAGAERTSARELEFAAKNRQLAMLQEGQPQWLLILVVGAAFLIGGFVMGKA